MDKTFYIDVKSVKDGDTFDGSVTRTSSNETPIGTEQIIRLAGVNAPERRKPGYNEAKEELEYLILGKNVRVDWKIKGHYHRILGEVTANGESANR